jgi:hypothetical protein
VERLVAEELRRADHEARGQRQEGVAADPLHVVVGAQPLLR